MSFLSSCMPIIKAVGKMVLTAITYVVAGLVREIVLPKFEESCSEFFKMSEESFTEKEEPG